MAKEYIKRIPEHLQEKIGINRFKISLLKVNDKEINKAKSFLDLKVEEIFQDEKLQNKKASAYLKICLQTYLNSKNIKNFKEVNELINKKIEKIEIRENTITIQSIILEAIEKRKKDFIKKINALSLQKVDTNLKIDGTLLTYYSILESVTKFFGKDCNVNSLTFSKVEKYAENFANNTYVSNLKSIFRRANIIDSNIPNHFGKLGTNVFQKFSKIDKVIHIFYYYEIENVLKELEQREQKEELKQYFLTLLFTGMRNDELASIKKSNIRNNCFYFKDSKFYFSKIVPIHDSLLDYINEKIKDLNEDDYLFLNRNKSNRRVSQIRDKFNSLEYFKEIGKTLHKTRSTFVTYMNFYCSDYNKNYTLSFTHRLNSNDQKNYNKIFNMDILKEIINKIDLENLDKIEEQVKLMEN